MTRPILVIKTGWSKASLRKWDAIPSENEDSEGSYFRVVGFPASAFDRPTDAIPHQSTFQASVHIHLDEAVITEDSAGAIERLYEFLLRPEYGPYHRKYSGWRRIVHAKCDELCANEKSTPRMLELCRRFQRLYPI